MDFVSSWNLQEVAGEAYSIDEERHIGFARLCECGEYGSKDTRGRQGCYIANQRDSLQSIGALRCWDQFREDAFTSSIGSGEER